MSISGDETIKIVKESKNSLTVSAAVGEGDLACAMGSGSLRVLATPRVAALMENAAARLADKILNSPELTTVGTALNIEHVSPTPAGAVVSAAAVLKSENGRTFEFDVTACDNAGEIARGTHTRVSVKAEKFQKKADDKLGK